MHDETVLQRFYKFKTLLVPEDIPNNLLLEMLESYLTGDSNDTQFIEAVPVMEGQLSLLDIPEYKELLAA